MKYGKTKLLFDTSLRYPKQFSHVGLEIAAQMETGKLGFIHLEGRATCVQCLCW